MKCGILTIALPFFMICAALAQTPPKENRAPKELIEFLFPVRDDDVEHESIYEVLLQLYLNPININRADAELLQSTYLLSPEQITNFLAYRERFGPLISLYELQAIPGFDMVSIHRIVPFLTVGQQKQSGKSFWNRLKDEEQSYLIFRTRRVWERRRGYTPADTSATGRISSRYLGDPNELYLRFRASHTRDFSLGFTLDKDPGEKFTWDPKTARYGFNFFSFHITRYNMGSWKTVSLGDYAVSFGQGLVFGAGYSLGKGAETVTTIRRSGVGIIPYTAAMEYGYFRGAAATYQSGKWQGTLITSHAPRDGRGQAILDSLGIEDVIISSFNQSGLHRTPGELSTKNQFREMSLGTNLQYTEAAGRFQMGVNALYTRFNQAWIRDPRPYNQFELAGQKNAVGSLYLNYNWKNFFVFGESAISKSGGTGTVFGLVSSLGRQVDFSMLWRNYDRNFHSLYANGFSEGTRSINERGIYTGIQLKPFGKWKINGYYDFFRFPWLKYRLYSPSKGYEWLSRISYQPSRSLLAYFQIREEQKERNLPDAGEPFLPYRIGIIKKLNGMVNLEYQLSNSFFLRSRILFSKVDHNSKTSDGFMILQDVQYKSGAFRLTGRYALFQTEDYDTRLYAFENNVLWTFSIPSFFGQGVRYYVLSQYGINRQLTVYFRFARTSYTDRETIGSGLQTIDGPHQTETSVLLRYMLNR